MVWWVFSPREAQSLYLIHQPISRCVHAIGSKRTDDSQQLSHVVTHLSHVTLTVLYTVAATLSSDKWRQWRWERFWAVDLEAEWNGTKNSEYDGNISRSWRFLLQGLQIGRIKVQTHTTCSGLANVLRFKWAQRRRLGVFHWCRRKRVRWENRSGEYVAVQVEAAVTNCSLTSLLKFLHFLFLWIDLLFQKLFRAH